MAFNRNKFKGSSRSVQKEALKQAEKANKKPFNGDYVRMYQVEAGENLLRIAPPHEEDQPFFQNKKVSILPILQDEYINGEKTGDKIVKNKHVFNAIVHGGLSADPVEIFVKYLYAKLRTVDSAIKITSDEGEKIALQKEQKIINSTLRGYRNNGKWVWGIQPMTSSVCYAWNEDKELYRLELRPAWLRQMDKIAASMDDDDSIVVDPFSDPNEGIPLIIKMNPDAKEAKDKYSISEQKLKRGESWDDFFLRNRVSDAQLQDLDSKPSLVKLFVKVYKRRDWDLAMEGLQRVDKRCKLGIFDDENFISELESLEKEVPTGDEEVSEEINMDASNNVETPKKPVVTEENEIPNIPQITLPKMKKAIKAYILENYEDSGLYSQIPSQKVDIRKWYDLVMEGEDLPLRFGEEETEENKEEENPVTDNVLENDTPSTTVTANKLRNMLRR